ncbi:MAG: DUF1326 domain-containing protein [Actinomycetota bacterium]
MGYNIRGEYIVNCDCSLICPCAVDGEPTTKDGQCHGAQILHVSQGTKDGTDLSGVDIGWVYQLPGKVTAGNWTSMLILDPSVSDEQVQAVEDIIQGKDGGPFADFAPLISTWHPTERVKVTFTGGKEAKGTIGDGTLAFSPLTGADGTPTTIKNAMLGFAPEFEIGNGSGSVNAGGIAVGSVYGEHANFEFAS